MDLMKWLSSLDELLFEVMSWLIFFPLTLWRTLTRPLAMMAYADEQLALPDEEQYAAALSPPLFLALALLLAHGASTAMGQTDALIVNQHGLAVLVNDQTSALLLRLMVFAIFPLLMAVHLARRRGEPITRDTLRAPFYGQCYPAAAFALALSIGSALGGFPTRFVHVTGVALIGFAFLFFVAVESRWLMAQLAIGPVRAGVTAVTVLIEGFILLLLVGLLFTR